MSDIFEEVDEALRKEKLLKVWEEYKNTIIASIAILIFSTAATSGYKSWNTSRNETETAKLSQALESEQPILALEEFVLDTRNNHKALAQLSLASLYLQGDEKEKAIAVYKDMVEKRGAPKYLRDQARILLTQHSEEKNLDVLKPILVNDKSPWVWHARIEAASILVAENNYEQALEYLAPFEDVTTIPLSLKLRGNALAHVYKIEHEQMKSNETEPAAGE